MLTSSRHAEGLAYLLTALRRDGQFVKDAYAANDDIYEATRRAA